MTENPLVSRLVAAIERAINDEGFTPEIEQEIIDTWPAIQSLEAENARIRAALEAFVDGDNEDSIDTRYENARQALYGSLNTEGEATGGPASS